MTLIDALQTLTQRPLLPPPLDPSTLPRQTRHISRDIGAIKQEVGDDDGGGGEDAEGGDRQHRHRHLHLSLIAKGIAKKVIIPKTNPLLIGVSKAAVQSDHHPIGEAKCREIFMHACDKVSAEKENLFYKVGTAIIRNLEVLTVFKQSSDDVEKPDEPVDTRPAHIRNVNLCVERRSTRVWGPAGPRRLREASRDHQIIGEPTTPRSASEAREAAGVQQESADATQAAAVARTSVGDSAMRTSAATKEVEGGGGGVGGEDEEKKKKEEEREKEKEKKRARRRKDEAEKAAAAPIAVHPPSARILTLNQFKVAMFILCRHMSRRKLKHPLYAQFVKRVCAPVIESVRWSAISARVLGDGACCLLLSRRLWTLMQIFRHFTRYTELAGESLSAGKISTTLMRSSTISAGASSHFTSCSIPADSLVSEDRQSMCELGFLRFAEQVRSDENEAESAVVVVMVIVVLVTVP